jgi:hypothetical protein
MTRRELIALLGSTAAAWPRAGWTQQPEGMRRLGVLMNVGEASAVGQRALVLFKEALERLGWSDERNLQLTVRWASCISMPSSSALGFLGFTSTAMTLAPGTISRSSSIRFGPSPLL